MAEQAVEYAPIRPLGSRLIESSPQHWEAMTRRRGGRQEALFGPWVEPPEPPIGEPTLFSRAHPDHPLTAARLGLGISIEGLAAAVGAGTETVRNWMSGYFPPRDEQVRALARLFGEDAAVVRSWFERDARASA